MVIKTVSFVKKERFFVSKIYKQEDEGGKNEIHSNEFWLCNAIHSDGFACRLVSVSFYGSTDSINIQNCSVHRYNHNFES